VSPCRREARRAGIFVAHEIKKPIQLRRSGICRPDGAGFGFGGRFYKDVAPTALGKIALVAGAFGVTVSAAMKTSNGENRGSIRLFLNFLLADYAFTIIFAFIVIFCFLPNASGQGFVNLGFEDAELVEDPNAVNSLWPYYAADAFPGWICYIDGIPQTHISYNDFPLESAAISLQDSQSLIGIFPEEGNYAAYLKPGDQFSSDGHVPSIGQTGTIPLYAQSISFWGDIYDTPQVTFNGQLLSFNIISSSGNYENLVANILSYAGQTGQLLFTGQGLIDNIQFSSSPAPEPTSFALFAVGMLGLCLRRCLK
jgi:hypothetical protein